MLLRSSLGTLAAVALCVAVGCSSGQSPAPIALGRAGANLPPAAFAALPGFGGRAAHSVAAPQLVGTPGRGVKAWVTDPGANMVYLCSSPAVSEDRPNPVPTGGLCRTSGPIEEYPWNEPQAVTNRDGLVYFANTGQGEIATFNEKNGDLVDTIDDAPYSPVDIALSSDSSDETIGVMNTSASLGGNIELFSLSGFQTVTGLLQYYNYGAFDRHGDFYNDGIANGKSVVGFVAKGSTVDTKTNDGSLIRYPDGMRFANDGSLNILDHRCLCIHIFKQSHETKMMLADASKPTRFSFDPTDTHVWISDAGLNAIEIYPYPAGRATPIAAITGFVRVGGVSVVREGSP